MNNKIYPIITVVIIVGILAAGIAWTKNRTTTTQEQPVVENAQQLAQEPQPTPEVMPATDETTTSTDAATDPEPITIAVEGGMFFFEPNEIKVKQGQEVTITLTSMEGLHDFVLDEFNTKTVQVPAGETTQVTFTPTQTGTFEFYCSVGNHRVMGMVGNLVVE